MSDLAFWAADHVDLWRPLALAVLSLVVLGCVRWFCEALDSERRQR